eukprot:3674431-Amphidinium_carterae.1
MQEHEEDVARCTAAHPTWHRRARLRRKKAGRRARRVGSRGAWSTWPTVEEEEEEEACDAILVQVWQHPDFELHADNDRNVYTRAIRSVSVQLSASAMCVREIGRCPVCFSACTASSFCPKESNYTSSRDDWGAWITLLGTPGTASVGAGVWADCGIPCPPELQ